MRTRFFFHGWTALIGAAFLFLGACSSDEMQPILEPSETNQTCTMYLLGTPPSYMDGDTRAMKEWQDEDVVYLRFFDENNIELSSGIAIYDAEKKIWECGYSSIPMLDKPARVRARYFEHVVRVDDDFLTLTDSSAVYIAYGTYMLSQGESGKVLTVNANLAPEFGRIRFKGVPGEKFDFSGIKYYTSYVPSTGILNHSKVAKSGLILGEDGFSHYIHGRFSDIDKPSLEIAYQDVKYQASISDESILKVGHSGWMNLPMNTLTGHNGWTIVGHYSSFPDWTSDATEDGLTSSKQYSFVASAGDILSFSYRVSAALADKFTAFLTKDKINTVLVIPIGGETTAKSVNYSFTESGEYVLTLSYSKNNDGITSGDDCAYVTNIKLEEVQ